jgi:hypothetical protein
VGATGICFVQLGGRGDRSVFENVEPGSIVSTDELMSDGLLEGDGLRHGAVNHSAKDY